MGVFGIDRFYLGKVGTGLLKLVTFAGFGVWYIVDLILILTGSMTDKAGKKLVGRKNGLKPALIITGVVLLFGVIVSAIGGASVGNDGVGNSDTSNNTAEVSREEPEDVEVEESPKSALLSKMVKLVEDGKAFDAGNYASGQIPEGEYAFVALSGGSKYYGEEDLSGNIIDNENFDSFGWVYVHGTGNVSTGGVLIRESDFATLGVASAKEMYTILNDINVDYNQSGYYKVGVDIAPGKYTLKSLGSAYVSVEAGPVGNSEIIDNENFNGSYAVTVVNGQYLSISRAAYSS